MVAALLYVIGLLSVLISIVLFGYNAPPAIERLTAAMDTGTADMVEVVVSVATGFGWVVAPVVGGLVLMGLGRIVALLGAINRSLRGQA